MPARTRLQTLLRSLQRAQGDVPALPRRPWPLILWENVAYLASDDARGRAVRQLERATGLRAGRIAAAPDEVLAGACAAGRMADLQVRKLRECAVLFDEVGDPDRLVRLPAKAARAALQRFPGIGAPGAERLLLFAGAEPVAAFDSNGLRVLLRLGYGREAKGYAASYRSAQPAASAELPADVEVRVDAYLRLRRHGQNVCRRKPDCAACAIASDCPGRQGVAPAAAGNRARRGRTRPAAH